MSAPILVAVDFSPCGRTALEAATRLALDLSTDLVLVHAYPRVSYMPALMGEVGTKIIQDSHAEVSKAEAMEFAENYVSWVRETGVGAMAVALDGEPADLILEQAKLHDVALIVLGTHGHRGLKRVVLGSVAEAVVRRTDRPVLVVPMGVE